MRIGAFVTVGVMLLAAVVFGFVIGIEFQKTMSQDALNDEIARRSRAEFELEQAIRLANKGIAPLAPIGPPVARVD